MASGGQGIVTRVAAPASELFGTGCGRFAVFALPYHALPSGSILLCLDVVGFYWQVVCECTHVRELAIGSPVLSLCPVHCVLF